MENGSFPRRSVNDPRFRRLVQCAMSENAGEREWAERAVNNRPGSPGSALTGASFDGSSTSPGDRRRRPRDATSVESGRVQALAAVHLRNSPDSRFGSHVHSVLPGRIEDLLATVHGKYKAANAYGYEGRHRVGFSRVRWGRDLTCWCCWRREEHNTWTRSKGGMSRTRPERTLKRPGPEWGSRRRDASPDPLRPQNPLANSWFAHALCHRSGPFLRPARTAARARCKGLCHLVKVRFQERN